MELPQFAPNTRTEPRVVTTSDMLAYPGYDPALPWLNFVWDIKLNTNNSTARSVGFLAGDALNLTTLLAPHLTLVRLDQTPAQWTEAELFGYASDEAEYEAAVTALGFTRPPVPSGQEHYLHGLGVRLSDKAVVRVRRLANVVRFMAWAASYRLLTGDLFDAPDVGAPPPVPDPPEVRIPDPDEEPSNE
jgi:hypothetical protein